MLKQPVGPLQRELKLDMSNPISALFLPLIDEAIAATQDGVLEIRLRDAVPPWFLSTIIEYGDGLYDRRKEYRPDPRGRERSTQPIRSSSADLGPCGAASPGIS